jgi:hypothetical protein
MICVLNLIEMIKYVILNSSYLFFAIFTQNFDEYMKALGVGYLNRKAACSVTPTLVYINEGNEWTLKMQSILKNHDTVFTDGVEFEESINKI